MKRQLLPQLIFRWRSLYPLWIQYSYFHAFHIAHRNCSCRCVWRHVIHTIHKFALVPFAIAKKCERFSLKFTSQWHWQLCWCGVSTTSITTGSLFTLYVHTVHVHTDTAYPYAKKCSMSKRVTMMSLPFSYRIYIVFVYDTFRFVVEHKLNWLFRFQRVCF